jgi:sn-glycerol 3-phosphate transport system ATP-binding protein
VEVYERPATRFVASFIGAPSMNLMDGQLNDDGSRLTLSDRFTIPLPQAKARWAGRPLTLGIRPEHIKLASPQDGLPLVVETLEMLGADNLAHGKWGGQSLVVRLPHIERPAIGSTLWLHLPTDSLHFFEPSTGQRLE